MTYHFIEQEASATAPLFVTFHGTGADERQFHQFAHQLAPAARIVSPRGDVSEHGANRFFKRTDEGIYDMPDLRGRVENMAAFVASQKAKGDPAHVLGLGYSNGANILAAVSFAYPDLFDSLVLLHPLITWKPADQPGLKGQRILITAGQTDPICPPDLTETLAAYYRTQGADVRLHWQPGGHEIARSEIAELTEFVSGQIAGSAVSERLHK